MQTKESLAERANPANPLTDTIPVLLLDVEAAQRWLGLNPRDSLTDAIASLGHALADDNGTMTVEHRAEIEYQLGLAWLQLPMAEYPASRQRAIDHLDRAVESFQRRVNPAYLGVAQHLLGSAWLELPTGDRDANLRNAISCYEAALVIIRREIDSESWALTQASLGGAWGSLSAGDRDANQRHAVECLDQALEVIRPESHPEIWTDIQHDLGFGLTLLGASGTPDSETLLRRAIACLDRVVEARGRENSPLDWAAVQCALASAWHMVPTGDARENQLMSMACLERAQRVYTRKTHPYEWAMAHVGIAEAWARIPDGSIDGAALLLTHCSLALEVLTHEDFTEEHAFVVELASSAHVRSDPAPFETPEVCQKPNDG